MIKIKVKPKRKTPTGRYWKAYNSLWNRDDVAPDEFKAPKPRKNDEDIEQIKFVAWLTEKEIHAYHPRNGGKLSPQEGAKFKRMGVRRGVPDICIPYTIKPFSGLYIELKRIDGKLSDLSEEQRWWLSFLSDRGYKAEAAFGAAHAIKITEDYFKLRESNERIFTSNTICVIK